jgi:HEPN domain-containing protein
MVQQAIEKSLKATLCHHGREVPQTHDIEFLVDRLSGTPASLPSALTETDFGDLSTFATLRRYEEGRSVIGRDEAQAAILLAEEILEWSRKEIFS